LVAELERVDKQKLQLALPLLLLNVLTAHSAQVVPEPVKPALHRQLLLDALPVAPPVGPVSACVWQGLHSAGPDWSLYEAAGHS
jgi:hypothetical protein